MRYFIFIFFISYCASQNNFYKVDNYTKSGVSKGRLTANDWLVWQHLDIEKDSIAGISLDKAYKLIGDRKGETITVAVLDTRLINGNKDLENNLWVNQDEIPNNNIDDDKNGYIDDVHGWNFIGNSNGEQMYNANMEFVRVIKKLNTLKKNGIQLTDKQKYLLNSADSTLNDELLIIKQNLNYLDSVKSKYEENKKAITRKFPNHNLAIEELNKLRKTLKDSSFIEIMDDFISYIKNKDWYEKRYEREYNHLNIYLNVEYNDRQITGDNSDNLNDNSYGNPNIFSDTINPTMAHSLKVVGLLSANRKNDYGIKGVIDTSKTMIVAVSPSGDEHDKDIALGIRYAVDNGAKIINITFTKYYSLYPEWVYDALKYAEANDVLVICAAGNFSKNIDNEIHYPNDLDIQRKESLNNVLMIGSSTPFANKYLVSDYSNFGKKNVDIYAPGEFIYSLVGKNTLEYESGTSLSTPMVSGVAALIRSYYPNLTAAEVKQIIMESGVSYDIMVNKPSTSKEKELVPFSSLSKSGKIVNAYNALLLAEKVSKGKKKKK